MERQPHASAWTQLLLAPRVLPHTRHGVRKVAKALLLKGMLMPNSNGNDGSKALNPAPARASSWTGASRVRHGKGPEESWLCGTSLLEGTGTWGDWHVWGTFVCPSRSLMIVQ